MPVAVYATNSISHSKVVFLGAFALLVAVAAVPISFRADRPPMKANSTLNCYDSAGNYEPCVTRASVSPSQFNEGTTEAHQPARWTTTALYQQAIWPTTAVDQPQFGQQAQSINRQIRQQAHQPHGAAVRQEKLLGFGPRPACHSCNMVNLLIPPH